MGILVLDATTKSIVVAMSAPAATNNPDFTAAYGDSTGALFTEGANDGALNGTSPVTLVAAPAAATRRIVKSITIENKDTADVTVTVSYNNNGTLRTIAKVTLAVGDTWTTDGTFDTYGSIKQTVGVVSLTSQVTGILPIANGGTGAATLAGANIAVFNVSNTFTVAQTFRAANAIRSEVASTQDAIIISGRAGGSNSYASTFIPTTLSASRTITLPDADINFTTGLGVAQGGTGQTSYTDGQLLIGNSTGSTLAKATLTAGSGISITNGSGSITIANTSTGGAQDYIVQSYGIV
jgi:hypothetical protein